MDSTEEIPQAAASPVAKKKGLRRGTMILVTAGFVLYVALQILAKVHNLPLLLNMPADDGEHLRWKKLLLSEPGDHLGAAAIAGEVLIESQSKQLYKLDSE